MWQLHETIWADLQHALTQNTPPLYQQWLVATAIFVLIRLWMWWRNRHVRRMLLDPSVFTGLWLAALMLLSMGALQYVQHVYDTYVQRAFIILGKLIA